MNGLDISEEQYAIKEFYDRFVSDLPKIIYVRHGYYGNAAIKNLEPGQVIRVECASKQKRVVAKDVTGRYLSLSVNHPIKCCYADKKGKAHGKPMELAELIEKCGLPLSVKFGESKLDIYIGAVKKKGSEYGPITLQSVYEERFLMGNNLENGRFIPDIIIIPLYGKAVVSVVTGFKCAAKIRAEVQVAWEWSLSCMEAKAAHVNYSGTKLTTEIAFYKPEQMVSDTSEAIYDTITPNVYGSLFRRHRSVARNRLERHPSVLSFFGKEEISDRKPKRSKSVKSRVQKEASPAVKNFKTTFFVEGELMPQGPASPPEVLPKPSNVARAHSLKQQPLDEDIAGDLLNFANNAIREGQNKSVIENVVPPPIPARSSAVPPKTFSKPSDARKKYEDEYYYNGSGISEDISIFKRTSDHRKSKTEASRQRIHDIQSLSVEGVADVLRKLNLGQHIDEFRENLVDGEILCDFDIDLLMTDFVFSKVQAIRLNKFIQSGHIPC